MTEQEKRKLRPLSKHEESVLEALHFMLSFEDLMREINIGKETLAQVLRTLIHDELVQALMWQSDKNDFIPIDEVPSDLRTLYFLATKHGLFSYHAS